MIYDQLNETMKTIRALVERRDTLTVQASSPVLEAARVMAEANIGAVPVLDSHRVVGIFTERDVMTRVVAAGRDAARTLVSEVMSTGLVVADLDDGVDSCVRRMKQAGVRHVLVLHEGALAGVLSLRDLLAVEIDEKEEAISFLNAYVHYIPADLTPKKPQR